MKELRAAGTSVNRPVSAYAAALPHLPPTSLHAPWPHLQFFVYNSLNEALPQYSELPKRLLRSAFIGFCASAVSGGCR